MQFDGQQSDERILSVITPHKSKLLLSATVTVVAIIVIGIFLFALSSLLPIDTSALKVFIIILLSISGGVAGWWNFKTYTNDKTFVTDRRIIRFDVVTPFFTNKRALFWNEILKVKAYAPNMIMRLSKVGSLQIEPVAAEHESITISDVYFHEDLANYIDKIIYTSKNKPEEVKSIRSFVPKPKGKRD